jgi:hypothetical protein
MNGALTTLNPRRNVDVLIAVVCLALYLIAHITDDVVVHLLGRWNLSSYSCFYSLRFWVILGLPAAFCAAWRWAGSFRLALLVPLIFGIGTAYLSAWLSQGVSDHWYDLLATPGLVGDTITERRVLGGDDWQVGEPWFHRHEIAAWNTLAWMGITLLLGVPFHHGLREFHRRRRTNA